MTQPGGIQPLHYIPFDMPEEARDVLFLGETGRAIIHSHVEAIDLWEVAVFVWPEVLGTLVGLWLLVALWIVWRRAHRPRRRGVLFCRRCNYELGAADDREQLIAAKAVCTECGRDITPRLLVPGRAQRWRVLRPLAVGLLPAVALGVLFAFVGLNRTGPPVRWLNFPSVRASELTAERGWTWFDGFRRGVDRFEEWDLEAGKPVRVIRTGPGRTYTRACLTADGSGLIAGERRSSSLVCIDTATGRVLSQLTVPVTSMVAFGEHAIVPHPSDAEKVFVLVLDRDAEEHVLHSWNTVSGESSELYRTPAWSYQPGIPVERSLALTTIDNEPMLVMLPTFMESFSRDVFEVSVLSLTGQEARTFDIKPKPDPMGAAVVPGEPRLYATRGNGLVGIDLETGKTLGILRKGSERIGTREVASTANGRLLLVPSSNGTILVRDTRATAWLPSLLEDTPGYAPQLSVSPEGRWVAAVLQRNTGTPAQKSFAHDVLIWKLPAEWFAEPVLAEPGVP
ncbi:MAG: hypothetical protein Q9O74_03205 [Planctomycetota bacterium]|nr:hypothetical protein [Planctomycetota bacterium]